MFSYFCYKIVDKFLRHNVKDNKKSVIFAPSGKKILSDKITVEIIYYYNV